MFVKNEEVIKLLQYYRHDLMNHIQVIKGYLSMGNTDKVNDKLDGLIQDFDKERILMNLYVPNFSLWILTFNSTYENIRLSYHLDDIRNSLEDKDEFLVRISNQFMEVIQKYIDPTILYNITLKLQDYNGETRLVFNLEGFIDKQKDLLHKLSDVGEAYAKSKESIDLNLQI